ncbi:hypothetical protein L210DRAFT_3403119 [Boletus edulis BED1]|uniref:COP9 signalosome complex subunit 3 n=1 Tax=Boletus edulis BED1 TaxID=1328754 RepID=A0AAD4BTE7_BOLED|nr:hypothetical protein L210DRAFT_3403119 [Boletus edulis BED1]
MSQPNLPTPPQQSTPQPEPEVQQQPSPVQSQASPQTQTLSQTQTQTQVPTSPTSAPENLASVSLVNIVTAITTDVPPWQLNQHLKTFAPKEVRDVVLASLLPDGQDPLGVLDIQANTLGILHILAARLHTIGAPNLPFEYVAEFCQTFVPEQARYTPEKVTLLAVGIPLVAEAAGNVALAIQPLLHLLTRYAPSMSHLTTIHPIFLKTCVSTRHFTAALPVLAYPITIIDTSISDLSYSDNLVYHYAGGMVYAALKRWTAAQEFFEICACSPGSASAAIQMEALKKLVLVQLIHEGKTTPPPKYIHPVLPRLLKGTPYSAFVNAYPDRRAELRSIVEGEPVFTTEKTLGLVLQALERAPRWSIKKLTSTYLTLHLSDIAHAVGIESVEEVRGLILDMIASSEISAQLSADGTVSFFDPPVTFKKEDVDRVLARAQEQATLLACLEKEMARSKEYLTKAVKGKEEASWGAMDDDSGDRMSSGHGWVDDIGFP